MFRTITAIALVAVLAAPSVAAASHSCSPSELSSLANDVSYNALVEFDVETSDIDDCIMVGDTSSFRIGDNVFVNCQEQCEVLVEIADDSVIVTKAGVLVQDWYAVGGWLNELHIEGSGLADLIVVKDDMMCVDTFVSAGSGNDAIQTDCGWDTIHGGNGGDVISSGKGQDDLYGGDDDDAIFAGKGSDDVDAGPGDDVVWGGQGNDLIHLGSGADLATGGSGNDDVHGGTGKDIVLGGKGADWLWGNDGNDWIYGEDGGDHMTGGSGDDYLWGSIDTDWADAGGGYDRCSSENKHSCNVGGISSSRKDDISDLRDAMSEAASIKDDDWSENTGGTNASSQLNEKLAIGFLDTLSDVLSPLN